MNKGHVMDYDFSSTMELLFSFQPLLKTSCFRNNEFNITLHFPGQRRVRWPLELPRHFFRKVFGYLYEQ